MELPVAQVLECCRHDVLPTVQAGLLVKISRHEAAS